jgi:hypothetical protein
VRVWGRPLLSVLCVTRLEAHALPFLHNLTHLAEACGAECVIAVDGDESVLPDIIKDTTKVARVKSAGYVESVLEDAIRFTTGDYILRLDDDERASVAMANWLRHQMYTSADHWSFPRVHLWGDQRHALSTPLLWPDPQTRLSIRAMAGGRSVIHAASPFGLGQMAPCAIEHHKFLVKTLDERREIAARYEARQPGTGSGLFLAFSCPEDYYGVEMPVYDRGVVEGVAA